MFNHIMIGSNDIERAKAFYDAVLGVLGCGEPHRNVSGTGHVRYFYRHAGSTFCLTEPIDGTPATVANGSTIGFKCESAEQLQRFHDLAVAQGGVSIEDPPGLREGTGLHLAYVRDLDGHKLCALYREKAKASEKLVPASSAFRWSARHGLASMRVLSTLSCLP